MRTDKLLHLMDSSGCRQNRFDMNICAVSIHTFVVCSYARQARSEVLTFRSLLSLLSSRLQTQQSFHNSTSIQSSNLARSFDMALGVATNGGSPEITFWTNHGCPWAHRVQIALKELGLSYGEEIIDLDKPRDEWYLKINPVCCHGC